MPGFVDIHSHVLHGLDDGAQMIEDSLAMLEIAARSGTTDLVATPHSNTQYVFRPELIAEQIAELQPRTPVRLHPGCDFHLSVGNIQDALAHPEKYTVNHGAYLLVEFPELVVFRAADEILRELVEAGMVPIISHPERNGHLRTEVDDLERWVKEGCYLQVTAASLTGLFGTVAQRSALQLIERGLVHVVASDAHNTRQRSPALGEAYERLVERWGEEAVRPLFVDNPAAVVASAIIEDERPDLRRRRKWYQFWKA